MGENMEDTGKTVRLSLESLVINETNDELKYRNKYLPDPRRLSDEKIVCTVCSVSLASRVRKGKEIFIHAILGVLVCKDCHRFYGDGIFSTDEDGDDKYCRWCGQGGTLYLCSRCNCGFCKKCMMKNMKNSALAAIENDDWKCLICVPRPIFGSRAVCWASKELNNTARKNELLRRRLEEEKIKLEADNQVTENESKTQRTRDETKKRMHDTEDSDSSYVFIPSKKSKKHTKTNKSLNGSVKKHRRKNDDSSSETESTDDNHSSNQEKIKRKKKKQNKCKSSSSEEDSPTPRHNTKDRKYKKNSIQSSDESSVSEKIVSKSKNSSKIFKKSTKIKHRNALSKRKKDSTSDSSSIDSKVKPRKKKKKHSPRKSFSESSSSTEDSNKLDKEKLNISIEEEFLKGCDFSDCGEGDTGVKDNIKSEREKQQISIEEEFVKGCDFSDSVEDDDGKGISDDEVKFNSVDHPKSKTNDKEFKNEILDALKDKTLETEVGINHETMLSEGPSSKSPIIVNELNELKNVDPQGDDKESFLSQQNQHLSNDDALNDEYTLSYQESTCSDEKLPLSQEDEMKVKVDLAIEWLQGVSKDIADLGSVISERTNKFGERKINLENLRSYEDVLLTLEKLRQLFGGIHANYKQIEDNLDDKLKSWRILAGLEKSDLEEEFYDIEEDGMQAENGPINNEMQAENGPVNDEIPTDDVIQVDSSELQGENTHSEQNEVENELVPDVDDSDLPKEEKVRNAEPETESVKEFEENNTQENDTQDIVNEQSQEMSVKETEKETEKQPLLDSQIELKDAVGTNKAIESVGVESDVSPSAMVKAEVSLKNGRSNLVWSGLLSSDNDSDVNDKYSPKKISNTDTEKFTVDDNDGSGMNQDPEKNTDSLDENQAIFGSTSQTVIEDEISHKEEPSKEETENFEALQELLYTSTEPEMGSSESDSNSSDDIQLDDSDLDQILKPKKVVIKKSSKHKELKVKEESTRGFDVKSDTKEVEDGEIKGGESDEGKKTLAKIETEKKLEEPLDSEAEIDMLTDLTKLKKKTVLRRIEQEESSEESSSENSEEDDGNEHPSGEKKKRKEYNKEVKKKREKERNELFGFLEGNSSEEDEVDITKGDLDVIEDQFASESSDSMGLEAFSRRMNEKWQELEKEQDQLNLQILLASESEPGSDGGDDLVLDSDEDKKRKKGKKIKEEKIEDDDVDKEEVNEDGTGGEKMNEEDDQENGEGDKEDKECEAEVKVKEEKAEAEEPDQEYEQFMKGLTKTKTTFTGLGSSSEEDKDKEIEIKEELLSDQDTEVKKEPKGSDEESTPNSDSSSDLFLDITKKKSGKNTFWKQHKLLRIKLSDTDTSDEERWWQRRLEREKKKKEQGDSDSSAFDEFTQALSPKKKHDREKKKEEDSSDKENKKGKKEKLKEEEVADSSSTLEMSSSDSTDSDIFKKKKKKKKDSTDSDVRILSDTDKKKKKKKKRMNLSGDSSDESGDSDDDVIDITQKSSQGESPGKGGRKNIRKVMTKHELAAATKAAAKEEEERKKRIAARQKMFNEMFEIKEAEVLEKLVLDFDPETKTELISVDKDLVTKMKPHQAKGVKFMWDSCFESLSQLKTKKGSGCILAHCMGLGKTFQVVSLVHTILTHKDTKVRTVLVVCPLSTVLNWYNEFDKWLDGVAGGRNIKIYHLTKYKRPHERARQLSLWHRTGGVMILGYEMFRILANPNSKKFRLMHTEVFQETLIDPGADLVVCDEGHMLKNESTLLSKAMSRIRTLRRIVLTGTPMQNNLKEYHCMVQFVKPNLLGTRKEFLNQFVNPITNGQFQDSTETDVKVMKRRAHVLHKMLEGLVQRFDYSVLTPFLPPKHEYVISLRLSDVQAKLYQFYLDYFCQKSSGDKRTSAQLFQDWQMLGRIWTHPRVLKLSTDKAEKERQVSSDSEEEPKRLRNQKSIKEFFKKKDSSSASDSSKQESEDEGSIKDFINDKSSSSSLSLSSSTSDDESGNKKEKTKKKKESVKKDAKEPKKNNPLAKEEPSVEPVDEINLISSEEEDVNKKESVEAAEIKKADSDIEEIIENEKADSDNSKNKAEDCGIEDQEGKTGDEPNETEEKTKADSDDNVEKENEKQENKEDKQEKEKKTEVEVLDRRGAWWKNIIEPEHLEDINQSSKLILLFAILKECELIEDKVLVFSQSLFSLDLIEHFLRKVDAATEENRLDESLGNHAGCWVKGLDYFRLDGSSSSESRSQWCKSFNKEDNPRARLFLISTRAGGLGINLTGANRVIIFDASWNPSHDIQSIFRIYRFGQKKPCYVYRFVAHGTMEEKVYERQVAKQLLSSRVVDEQQVQRHFSMSDLNELYTFTPPAPRDERPTPALPKDRLMAELLTQYSDWIEKYHEHDSLLENIADEELNEEERKLAWEDYENEKKRGFPTPTPGTGVPNFPGVANQMELFRKSLRLKFPNATETEMAAMLQTLMYQVNYRTLSQQLGAQQQPGQPGTAGPSQQQPNFRPMNTNNAGPPASYPQMVLKMNQVYQQFGSQPTQQQRVGTNQMNQQRATVGNGQVNQQRIGNKQIRQTNKTNQEMFREQMRKQQEANLQRIQNQRKFQQQGQPQQTKVVPRQYQGVARGPVGRQPQPSSSTQNRNQPMWKANQPPPVAPNRLQQMQKQRENAVNKIVNSGKQLQGNLNRNKVNPQQPLWKTVPQNQKRNPQEEMRQRIKQMQIQKDRQEKMQQNKHRGQDSLTRISMDPIQQRQLEEMKKRYNATRMKQRGAGNSKPISIVEINDDA